MAHGVRIKIRLNDPDVGSLLLDALPPGWRHTSDPASDLRYAVIVRRRGRGVFPGSEHQLFFGAQVLHETGDLDELFAALAADLHFRIAVVARHKVFVNAGVVGWMGQAMLLPGGPRIGKSTLVRALVRAGATYYSDMFAVVDAYGSVHAYGVPIEADPGTEPYFEVVDDRPSGPLPVGLVAFTRFGQRDAWRPRLVSAEDALERLMDHAVLADIDRRRVRSTLARAVRGALAVEGPRGEAGGAAQALLATLTAARGTAWSDPTRTSSSA